MPDIEVLPEEEVQEELVLLPQGLQLAILKYKIGHGGSEDHAEKEKDRWIMLHGWQDNSASFALLAPQMLRSARECNRGIEIVCVDFPGHGRSDHRAACHPNPYHFIDYVGDVCALVNHLGWDCFNLMGHSLGGNVALILAGTWPERVQELVLIESIGPSSAPVNQVPISLSRAIEWEDRAAKGKLRSVSSKRIYETVEKAAERRHTADFAGSLTMDAARILASRGCRQAEEGDCVERNYTSERGIVWRNDPRLKAPSRYRFTEDSILSFARNIQCATLLVMAKDGIYKKATIAELPFYSRVGGFLFGTLERLLKFVSWTRIPGISKRAESILASGLVLAATLSRRIGELRNRLTILELKRGGHHPHMDPKLASAIADMVVKVWSRCSK